MESFIFHCLYTVFLLVFMLKGETLAADPYTQALLSIKSEIVDEYNNLDDWVVSNDGGMAYAACSWSGVKCNNNSTAVLGLDLSMSNLGGSLSVNKFAIFTELLYLNLSYNSFDGRFPAKIFNLTNLRILDVRRNNFSGDFPTGFSSLQNLVVFDAFSNSFSGSLPVEISELENLKVLNLAGSYFNGEIPPQYGSFKNLEFLHLAGNFLTGKLPPQLGMLKTVTHMEIGYNFYHGSIPWQFGNMSELQYLDIAGGNLSGVIPKELSNLTKLHSLFLFRNHFSGSIPSEFSSILPLTSLDLSDNQISGQIPESFRDLKNLRLLSLMYNNMNGSVPEAIAQLPSLETLLIWSNFFTGSLPESLGRNSKLKLIDVSTNNFVGVIPPDICAGGELNKLILFSNNFTGNLSPSISNCSSLVRLRVEDNSFSGDIPFSFSNLPDIMYIDLSSNKFTSGIPANIHEASKLQYFNISNNPELGGQIPSETWSLQLLQNFSASSCNISGDIPSFEPCKSISVIEIHKNNLSGTIPTTVSNCQSIEKMNFANNKLFGHIPEGLASLHALRILDLSYNNLSGSIPTELGNSSSLVALNVSFNDISGSIPSENLFSSMDRSSYIGNPKLCGAPLHPCSASMAMLGGKGNRKLMLALLLSALTVTFVVSSAFLIQYFRRRNRVQWKMVSFEGLPPFTANDVLRSFSCTESMASIGKTVLPTGITVSVKKIEWGATKMRITTEFLTLMGNARHRNVIRYLGYCYNKHNMAYLLYDYLPHESLADKNRMKCDWETKYKIVIGIARGLCFLHHGCFPAIPHGDLKASNIVFNENMEPQLAEFGLKYLMKLNKGPSPTENTSQETGKLYNDMKEELFIDIYSFGEVVVEFLTNGRLKNAGESIQSKSKSVLVREIYKDNKVELNTSVHEEIKLVVEVALLCTRGRLLERPSMEEALSHLLRSKSQGN